MKGYIYTIKSINNDSIYVGSTIKTLNIRWASHKKNCIDEKSPKYNIKLYQYIRENGGLNNWFIELYEDIEINNKIELRIKEEEIIQLIGNLNDRKAYNAPKEYIKRYEENNKKIIKEKHSKYYEEKKEIIKKRVNEYYQLNKDKIKQKALERYYKKKSSIILG
jgi:hypothetical protein